MTTKSFAALCLWLGLFASPSMAATPDLTPIGLRWTNEHGNSGWDVGIPGVGGVSYSSKAPQSGVAFRMWGGTGFAGGGRSVWETGKEPLSSDRD